MSIRLGGTAPTVGWLPVLALAFVALVMVSVAWSTHRSLHRRHERLQPHHAVNRLVLAKSCSLAGALVAGGYLGYALSWLGLTDAELAHQRMVHALRRRARRRRRWWPGRCSSSERVGSVRTSESPTLSPWPVLPRPPLLPPPSPVPAVVGSAASG